MVRAAVRPIDPLVETVFDGDTGYAYNTRVVKDGISEYDKQTYGEANERTDLWHCSVCTKPAYADSKPKKCECGSERFRKGKVFVRIRCLESELQEFWKWAEHESGVKRLGPGRIYGHQAVEWERVNLRTGERHGATIWTPEDVAPEPDLIVERIPVRRLDLAAHRGVRRPLVMDGVNVYGPDAMRLITANDLEEFKSLRRALDTHENAFLDVKKIGGTYSDVNTALGAASSGDSVGVFVGTYAENVVETSLDGVQLFGVGGVRPAIITASSGIVLSWNESAGYIGNLKLVATGTASYAMNALGAHNTFRDLFGQGGVTEVLDHAGTNGTWLNCAGVGSAAGAGIDTTDSDESIRHCLGADCNRAFQGQAFGGLSACVGFNSADRDFVIGTSAPTRSAWNAGKDDVVGTGSVTGLDPTDFDGDYLYNTAATLGKFDGSPLVSMDGQRQVRKPDSLVFFAGWDDPDPLVAAVPGQPNITGVNTAEVTVAGVDTNCKVYSRPEGVPGNTLTLQGNTVADGTVALGALAPGRYDIIAQNQDGSFLSLPDTAPLTVPPTSTSLSALNPLQKAIGDLLTADTILMAKVKGIFDEVPENQEYPYVTVGEADSSSYRTHGRHGENVLVTLHIWSQSPGNQESLDIQDDLNRLLGDIVGLPVDDFEFVGSWFDSTKTLRAPDGITRHVVARYRMRVQIIQ